MIAIETIKLL
jgi:serine/threonine protein kinase